MIACTHSSLAPSIGVHRRPAQSAMAPISLPSARICLPSRSISTESDSIKGQKNPFGVPVRCGEVRCWSGVDPNNNIFHLITKYRGDA